MCDFMVTGFYQQRQLAKAVLTQPWLLKSWDAMQNVILKKKECNQLQTKCVTDNSFMKGFWAQ